MWCTPSHALHRGHSHGSTVHAYWRLDERSGRVVADVSGNGDGAYQAGAPLADGLLVRFTGARYVFLIARRICSSMSVPPDRFVRWGVVNECWANVTPYANPAGADGRYTGTAGVRFIGNTTWTGGANRQAGLEWELSNSDAGRDTRWQIVWVRDYQSLNVSQGSAPPTGWLHHFVLSVAGQGGILYQDGVQIANDWLGDATIRSVCRSARSAGPRAP